MLIDLPQSLLRAVFHFLNERDRLRCMVTNKAFESLLIERKEVAKEALKLFRQTCPGLKFDRTTRFPNGTEYRSTFTVRLHRGDPDLDTQGDLGLMRVVHASHMVNAAGAIFRQGDFIRFFSPWACAFVHPWTGDDERIRASEDPESLYSRLAQIAKRVV